MASNKTQQRYQNPLVTQVLPDGRTVYMTNLPNTSATSVNDITIIANDETRLDVIAQNVYGSALDYWRIARTLGRWDGSLHVTPGTFITIPRK